MLFPCKLAVSRFGKVVGLRKLEQSLLQICQNFEQIFNSPNKKILNWDFEQIFNLSKSLINYLIQQFGQYRQFRKFGQFGQYKHFEENSDFLGIFASCPMFLLPKKVERIHVHAKTGWYIRFQPRVLHPSWARLAFLDIFLRLKFHA